MRATTTKLKSGDVLKAVDKATKETGLTDANGKVSHIGTEFTEAEAGKVTQARKAVVDALGDGPITGQSLHNARMVLDKFIDYADPSVKSANGAIKNMRRNLDALAKENIPGLKELDAAYSEERQFYNDLKRDLLKKDGTPKDNLMNVVRNLTNKGNEAKLARVEKILPGIGEEVKALRALEDWNKATGQKIGTYGRAATIGG